MNKNLPRNQYPGSKGNRPASTMQRKSDPVMQARYAGNMNTFTKEAPLLRSELGEVLRSVRQAQGRTLREVSSSAQVSLGYLSEVERGQKEASSELLEAICAALGTPLWFVLREVSDRLAVIDGALVPDTVPDNLMPVTLLS